MMKPKLFAALLAALAVAAPTAADAKRMRCAAVTERDIERQFDAFNAAWATRQAGRVADLFGPDAVLLATVAATPRTDRAGIEDYFDKFLKGAPVGTIETSTIDIGCNMATRVGTWTVRFAEPTPSEARARYSFIYKYQDGRWVIDHLHSSVLPANP